MGGTAVVAERMLHRGDDADDAEGLAGVAVPFVEELNQPHECALSRQRLCASTSVDDRDPLERAG